MAKPHIRLRADAGGAMPVVAAAVDGIKESRSMGDTAHRAASFYDRDVAAWRPRGGSADADLLPELGALRTRARDIDRNNGVAKGGIQTIVDNVVGTGLRLAARPDYKALGKSKEWADEWSAKVHSSWRGWAWTTACHAGDTLTFDQLTAQALRSELTNGDAIGVSLWMPDRGDGYRTKIQSIESDRMSNPNYEVDSPTLRGGVKLNQYGAPLGYFFRNAHPGDAYMAGAYATYPTWEFVPRRTPFGRLRVFHVFDQERSGQNRGKPILSSVLSQFKQADRYVNAEIAAAVVNGMVAGLITTPMDMEDIVSLFQNEPEKYLQMRRDHAVGLQSGSLIPLAPGDDFKSFLPQRPAAQFGTFMTNVYRIIACGLDIPYELLLKDFSQTNYSSARAAMLEAWRSFNRRRDWLGTKWCDPIYWNFLEEKVNDGTIDAPGFYENRAAYQACKWIGPGKGWVDEVKEATAMQIRIDTGVSTLEDECASQGKDWEDVMEQRATELQRAKDLNIPQIVSGRATVVPEDASDAAGEAIPGSAPPSGPNQPVAQGDVTTFAYRMEVPGESAARRAAAFAEAKAARKVQDVTDRSIAALTERFAALEAGVLALAARPVPASEVHFEEGAFQNNIAPPQVNVETGPVKVEQAPPAAPVVPQRRAVEKEVLERDAEGRILRTRETEIDAPIAGRGVVKVIERDTEGRISKVTERSA